MKSDQATIQQRVSELLTIRLQGAEWADIVQYASEKAWGVGERQLRNYVRKSDDLLAETLETHRGRLINRHVAQRRALYARCMAVSDYSNARAVLKDEAELLGLYPAKKTEVTGKDGGPIQTETVVMSDDERRATLESLLAAVGSTDPGSGPGGEGDPAKPALDQPVPGDD